MARAKISKEYSMILRQSKSYLLKGQGETRWPSVFEKEIQIMV